MAISAGRSGTILRGGTTGTGRHRMVRRGASRWWCDVVPLLAASGLRVRAGVAPAWPLVLASRGIPYRLQHRSWGAALYVPLLYERLAAAEILRAEHENTPAAAVPLPAPVFPTAAVTYWVLLCLAVWHGVRMHWWPWLNHFLPTVGGLSAEQWAEAGRMDGMRVLVDREWFRVVTALTLHADSGHLLGNVVSGGVFMPLLCRRTGAGAGWLLVLLAGAAGNVCSVLFSGYDYLSMGASTGVFGAVGALCGITLALEGRQGRVKAFAVIAAGLGLLAMLGMEGERTDITAHVAGLVCGFAAGRLIGGLLHPGGAAVVSRRWMQTCCGLAAVLLTGAAWGCALAVYM